MPENDPSRNLWPKKDDPYQVIKVHDHTFTAYVSEIYNVLQIDSIFPAKTKMDAILSNTMASPSKEEGGLHTDRCSSQHNVCDKQPSEYAVSKLVSDRQKNVRTQYRMRWYAYTPAEDTWKPVKHIPHTFWLNIDVANYTHRDEALHQ